MENLNLTISRIHEGLLKKEFSAKELAEFYLKRIERENKKINAFLEVSADLALLQAKKVDEMILEEREIPLLAGVPCAIKDNILVEGSKCTAGSKFLENYIAPYDATCIVKLKSQRVVILGKTNLDEFAMGSSTENSAFGVTKNPCNLERVAGGSSGGSAAAVKADLCVFALGSDTGGSIRQPASFCGVLGLKPTYGTVSRYGLIAFASSLDQIGPLAKNVKDLKIVFEIIKGKDRRDATSRDFPEKERKMLDLKNVRIGFPKECFSGGLDTGVKEVVEKAIEKYQKNGAQIEQVSLPHLEYALPCYYIIASSEASANLARYDGMRYGKGVEQAKDLFEYYLKSKSEGFGKEVKRRIMLGTFALSRGYFEAYYLRAEKVRQLIKQDFEKVFKKVDFIFTPVCPTPAFKIGEKIDDPLKMYLSDIFTVPVNLAGLPALSLPCGKIDQLPVGLQIIGKPFNEEELFQLADFYEKF